MFVAFYNYSEMCMEELMGLLLRLLKFVFICNQALNFNLL